MWQWFSPVDGFWHAYDTQAQEILDDAKKQGSNSVVMFIEGQCTVVNLKAMTHVDSSTGCSCEIRYLERMSRSKLPARYGSLPNRYTAFVPPIVTLPIESVALSDPLATVCAEHGSPTPAAVCESTSSRPGPTTATLPSNSHLPQIDSIASCSRSEPSQPVSQTFVSPTSAKLTKDNLDAIPLTPALQQMTEWLRSIELPPKRRNHLP